jgi:hypothetical protein
MAGGLLVKFVKMLCKCYTGRSVRVTGVLDFVHCLELKTRKQRFRNWVFFHPYVKGGRHILFWAP